MANNTLPRTVLENLLALLKSTEDVDVLREAAEWMVMQLMEAEVTELIGAERFERTESRTTQRNGARPRSVSTRLGELELQIPKLRQGTYYPEWLLERQKTAERALTSVVMEAYVNGVSTRKVDRLVTEMGLEGIDKSTVSRINKGLDERVAAFRDRPLEASYPYLWLDATFPKVREGGRVQSTALVVAMAVREDGHREIIGLSLGAAETESFWKEFLRDLVERGLGGVQLVISDAHSGLKNAIDAVLTGAMWQRCRVHFMRDILTYVPASAQDEVANQIRTIFAQPSLEHAQAQAKRIISVLRDSYDKAADILEDAMCDLLAHMHFPKEHWRRIRSTNPLERLNKEIKRRFNVVGIFPNRDAAIRLAGAMLLEQHEEWLAGRRYFSEESMAKLAQCNDRQSQLAEAA